MVVVVVRDRGGREGERGGKMEREKEGERGERREEKGKSEKTERERERERERGKRTSDFNRNLL